MKRIVFLICMAFICLPACSNSAVDQLLIRSIQDDNLRDAMYWLDHGANANCVTNEGNPLLLIAMDKDYDRHHSFDKFDNSVPLTELLLENGADPNSSASLLPLIAAINLGGDYRLCNVLLRYGANPFLVESYGRIKMNAIDYAKSLGYTRVANLLANPKNYSTQYTVFELNYLMKISFSEQKYDETIKYCNQLYKQLPQELSSKHNGWLTTSHVYIYHESALFQKSLIASQNNRYDEAEQFLSEAIKYEDERRRAGDTTGIGVDLNQALLRVKNWQQNNPSSVIDDLTFLLQQGRKDATTITYLISAADYYQQIYDAESRDYCLRTAYQWVKDDPSLRNQLSKDILFSLFLNCTTRYCRDCEPIMTEADLQDATNYIKNEFGAKSFYAYQYEIGKVLYYSYLHELDKAIAQCKAIEEILEKELKASNYSNEERENIREQYVQANVFLSDLYGSKYPYSAYQYKSIDDTSTGNSPSQEQMLAYNIMKKVLDDSRLNKDLHLGCYQSMIYMCYHFEKFEEMWKYVPQYYTLTQQTIDNALTTMSEDDALHWWGNSLPFMYNDYIILSTNRCNLPTGISGYIYDNELFKKDLLLRTNKRLQQYISESADSTIIYLYNNLVSQKAQLLQLQSQKQMEDATTKALRESIASNERLLATVSNVYAQRKNEMNITCKDIQSRLKPNEVAIEFVNCGSIDQYWALILRKDYSEPKFVYLPDFKRYYPEDIKYQMDSWRKFGEPYGIDEPEFLQFAGNDAGEIYKYGGNGTKLYEALWNPLKQYLQEGDVVYFAPSGVLLQLAIEALPVDAQTVLSDHYKLVRLSSTRELALSHSTNAEKAAVLYGNILYSADDIDIMAAESERYQSRNRGQSNLANDGTNRGSWKYLPATKAEVNNISTLLSHSKYKSTIYELYHANEESFKALSGNAPQVLHIATHGFYWDNDRASTEPFVAHTTPQGTTMVDPLTRCGLLFAGANIAYSGHGSSLPKGVDDGILTAKEISLLDLQNTKLLVLSACETGLGELTDAGVFGLQRAFKQAGVETIVMALWKVDDEYTQKMMSKFYELWLSGQDKRTAFYNAQKYIRSLKPNQPYYWAGFIMLD